MLLEDGGGPGLRAANGFDWRCVTDGVMGGVSQAALVRTVVEGRNALHLTGDVRLENNGGFAQMALDLAAPGEVLDASQHDALLLVVRGNGQEYNIHLRSPDMTRVWQSWRASFRAPESWETLRLPLAQFTPYRTDLAVNPARLSRIGLVAIGRAMRADLALARLELV